MCTNSMKTCIISVENRIENTIVKLSRKDRGNREQRGQCILTSFGLMSQERKPILRGGGN